jgi:hypothetical protein
MLNALCVYAIQCCMPSMLNALCVYALLYSASMLYAASMLVYAAWRLCSMLTMLNAQCFARVYALSQLCARLCVVSALRASMRCARLCFADMG